MASVEIDLKISGKFRFLILFLEDGIDALITGEQLAMTSEMFLSRFPVMSMFGNKKISDQAFSAASDSARDDYEELAQRRIELKRRLRELEHQGAKKSAEYKGIKAELQQIESQM